MSNSSEQLFRILVAIAWIDGEIQPQEREYLHNIATSRKLIHNQEIQKLLSFSSPISIAQCNNWIDNYLEHNPTQESCRNLISEIAALVYCDDNIDVEEAKILVKLETYPSSHQRLQTTLNTIRNIYRKGLEKLS